MMNDKNTPESRVADKDIQAPPGIAVTDQVATIAIWQQNIRTLVALNVVSVSVAVLLFVGLLFSWVTIADLNQVRAEIDGLKQFEKRIAGNVDLMNAGIQNRLAKIDRRISSIQSHVSGHPDQNAQRPPSVRQLDTVANDGSSIFASAAADLMLAPALTSGEPGRFEPKQPGVRVSLAQSPDKPEGSSLFRRVVTPDGKVRYEKRQ